MKFSLLFSFLIVNCIALAQLANWSPVVGGTNFPTDISGQINGISRISQLKFHPTDPNIYYAITGEGGFFTSTDQGSNWTVSPGTELITNNCASVCVDYSNAQNILLGTGDANYYSSSSAGVLKSTNGGATFSATSLTNCLVVEILQNPTNSQEYVAATNKGIYKSTNGGSTWSLITANNIPFCDLKSNTALNSQILYACTEENVPRFYRSTNFGTSWTQITSGVIASTIIVQSGSRIGVTPANSNVVYLSIVGGGGIILKSTDGGLNFATQKAEGSPYLSNYSNNLADPGQGNYNHTITVDRLDPAKVWLQAHATWYSSDNGITWTQLTDWYADVHTDMHEIIQSPHDPTKLYSCNDGGVWLSTDGGNNWTPKSNGIYAYEIYDGCGSNSLTRPNYISIGTQDNGRVITDGAGWFTTGGGDDGAKSESDYLGYTYYGDERRVQPTGAQNTYGLPVTSWNDFSFNRTNPELGFMGTTDVYRCTNLSSSATVWTQISSFNSTIRSLHSAIDNTNKLYVLLINGDVYVSTNALAATPIFTLYTLPGSASSTGSIVAMANNENIVYVQENSAVYRSPNGGLTWTNITANLPNVNHRRILAEEYGGTEELVFIATNNAVYYKKIGQANWTNYSTNLSARRSPTEFAMFDNGSNQAKIRYFSYGRAVFESSFDNLRVFNANIIANDSLITCNDPTVQFVEGCFGATNLPITYSWSFPGGTPATSTASTVDVSYPTTGTYSITLTATNGLGVTSSKTISKFIQVNTQLALPMTEAFVSNAFPPNTWNLFNVGSASEQWERTTTAGSQGSSNCMKYNNYDNTSQEQDEFRSATYNFTNLTSASLTFDVAYRRYASNYSDSLAVLISTDCGITFSTVYYTGGTALATVAGDFGTAQFVPTAAQWRTENVNLTPFIGLPNVMIVFQNRGHWGQTIYVDNINLTGISTVLTANFTPSLTSVCTGANVTFTDASSNATSWSWDFGIGATPANATGVGPHTVSYASSGSKTITLTVNGTASSSQTITVSDIPTTPLITAGSATTFCEGGSVVLTSSSASGNTWSTGATTPTITVSTSGTTTVTTTTAGCTSGTSAGMVVTVNPNPVVAFAAIPDMCVYNSPVTLIQGTPIGGTYSGNGVNAGQFDPTIAGIGTTTITYDYVDGNNCSASATSTVLVDACLGMKEYTSSNIHVFPNPSSGLITVDGGNLSLKKILIFDNEGKLVETVTGSSETILQLDLSKFAAGIYTLEISTPENTDRIQVLVQK